MPKADINYIPASDIETPAASLAEQISEQLKKDRAVLWLVSGGSSIKVAVRTREILSYMDLSRLHVGLTDERYGPPKHGDSNWQQLLDSGFDTAGLNGYPVLSQYIPIQQAVSAYSEQMQSLLAEADYKVGLFGIGSDGHTAGLLPGNPLMGSGDFYGQYCALDFDRISATPKLIEQLDLAMAYAAGQDKWPALETLLSNDTEASMPAQVLNRAVKLKVFSDYQGGPK